MGATQLSRRAPLRSWSGDRGQRPGGQSDICCSPGRRVGLQPRAHRRRPGQYAGWRLRLQPRWRRGNRARRGRARRAVVALGLRRDGLGGAGLHQARRRPTMRRSVSGSVEGGIVRHLARCDAGDWRRQTHDGLSSGRDLPQDRWRVCRHPSPKTTGSSRLRSTVALAVALGARASVRTGLRYSHAQGRSVSDITYRRAQHSGQRTTRRICRGTPTCRTRARVPLSRDSATINYFRYDAISADTFADPTFTTYTILEGTPNALFPERRAAGSSHRSGRVRGAGGGRRDAGPRAVPGLGDHFDFGLRPFVRPRVPTVPPPGRAIPGRLCMGRRGSG